MTTRISVDTEADMAPGEYGHMMVFPFLDEFVSDEVASVHFEAMSNAQFWIGVRLTDGREYAINCGAVNPNAKGYSRIEEET